MSIVMQYVDRLHEILDKNADQRTTDWFMMSSPFPTLFICLAYVYVVKVLGPKMMENRKPFQLKNALVVYNMLQMLFSAWLFYEVTCPTIAYPVSASLLRPFLSILPFLCTYTPVPSMCCPSPIRECDCCMRKSKTKRP